MCLYSWDGFGMFNLAVNQLRSVQRLVVDLVAKTCDNLTVANSYLNVLVRCLIMLDS